MDSVPACTHLVALGALCVAPASAQWSTLSLSEARRGPAAVTVGGKAVFAGGRKDFRPNAEVDVYDDASGTWSTAQLSLARADIAAAAVGPYALFAGGSTNSLALSDIVDVLDTRTMTWSTAALSLARNYAVATTVGTKALFAGGSSGSLAALTPSARVDIYDASLGPPGDPNAWSTAQLSVPRGGIAATTVGSQAIFAGGFDGAATVFATVDLYDDATGQWSTAMLSEARVLNSQASATVGSRAYFGGGFLGPIGPATERVDIYDAQTGAWSTAALSEPRGFVAALAVGDVVHFAGGIKSLFVGTETVDTLLVGPGLWSAAPSLSVPRGDCGATTVGGKAYFAGGAVGLTQSSIVIDVYDATVGTTFCGPAVPNSSGVAGETTAFGSTLIAHGDLTLVARRLPVHALGFFLCSRSQGFSPNPAGSQGNLCLAGSIGRFVQPSQVQSSGAAGRISITVDLGALPTPQGPVTATPGETWSFQAWHRDAVPQATSNFTAAIGVTLN